MIEREVFQPEGVTVLTKRLDTLVTMQREELAGLLTPEYSRYMERVGT